ncbi:T9SS type A sorting domain-containing protein [Salinivirga cyanobacteriivorans]
MKTTLIIIGLLLQSLVFFGQPFQSIFSSDTVRWHVFEFEADAGGTIVYYSFSDTVINDKVYHTMYREDMYTANQQLLENHELCGYVHEDTTSGKYWFLKFDGNEQYEALYMDLSLSVGDTMVIVSDFNLMWTDSVIVDSVYYENDRKNIRLNMTQFDGYEYDKITFIEGVGASNGFYMGEYNVSPVYYTLMCKFDNDVKTYAVDKEWFINCFHEQGGGIYDSKLIDNISIYPNPAKGKITIEIEDNNFDMSYKILNSLGQIISTGKLRNTINELEIEENGIFFITISNAKYEITKKLITYGY